MRASGRSALESAGVKPGSYLLLTLHREANVRPSRSRESLGALNAVTEPIVFPAHPRTLEALSANRIALEPHIRLVPPAGYIDFAALASQARLVLTDSGGVQKEAYWYGVPCVTLRTSDRVGGDRRERVGTASSATIPI